MQLRRYPVHPALRGSIEKIWVFDNPHQHPANETGLIVPNGLIKLVIPFRSTLAGFMEGCRHVSAENEVTLIGICDRPSTVLPGQGGPSASLGIEFSPAGAYRFFHIRQQDIANRILPLKDIAGPVAAHLEEQMANAQDERLKVALAQDYLLGRYHQRDADRLFEYCVGKIRDTNGRIRIAELERLTGYSSRWLNRRFNEALGIGPKKLAAITRFQYYYTALTRHDKSAFHDGRFYLDYFDQSHLIRDFNRFAGMSPTQLQQIEANFGTVFYRD